MLPQSLGQALFSDYTASVRATLHRFLLIVLMLALPLQAFASAAMLGCVFSHQEAAEQEQMAMADGMMAGCHEPAQSDAPPVQHDCTHCAVCALASALPIPTAAAAAVMSVRQSYALLPAATFSGHVPEGPERPPRPHFA